MTTDRLLVTVKTYPTLSRKYGETVCTAGVREDGSWVRRYPVPFRPIDPGELHSVGHVGTQDEWCERRNLILKTARVYDRLEDIIDGAKANQISLAVFKPARIVDFIWEEDTPQWDPAKLREMRDLTNQLDLFDDNAWRKTFQVIPKLPYNFSYRFEDAEGRSSELQVLEWQVGALYWNCLKSCNGNKTKALEKVRQKYFDQFTETDLHFFVGTTQHVHFVAPNPWVIIGVFPIPHEGQLGLL